MGGNMKDRWSVPVTAVANEFIDTYMAAANGEYVKVYLYVLRHQGEDITIELIADALNHTESDVRRALSYWKKAGVLTASEQEQPVQGELVRPESGARTLTREQDGVQAAVPDLRAEAFKRENGTAGRADVRGLTGIREQAGVREQTGIREQAGVRERTETMGQEDGCIPVYSTEQVNRLAQDEEFSQLLYIAQKYMNKVFTPRDCQVFAYLYEGLSMSSELLEYLVEYCVQNGHISVRYMETVAMSWHEKGIRTALEAKDYSTSHNRDSFAVMKAFGINSRKPAAPEQKLMDKWFRDYGFSREVVLEACNRTITAIHNPSFQYADKILSDWQKAGVRGLADIKDLDVKRTAAREESGECREKRLQKYDSGVSSARQGSGARKNSSNQFHNFKQRDTDYDALVLKQVKEWVGQQP
uniref:DnaD domain protein n=1 Tax=Enterocloster clostridioformis TaxID=1531 RepID=UPI0026F2646A|nr:DnaD domain protein [Enterocloster clostridioformis]